MINKKIPSILGIGIILIIAIVFGGILLISNSKQNNGEIIIKHTGKNINKDSNSKISVEEKYTDGVKHTNYEKDGGLNSNNVVVCSNLNELKNSYTPADIFNGVELCINQKEYEKGVKMLILALSYGSFDSERVKDKTAGQAISMLKYNHIESKFDENRISDFDAVFMNLMNDTEKTKVICQEIEKIGMPNYYPSYMIEHGVEAFSKDFDPKDGLLQNFNSDEVWADVFEENCVQ
ncbi:MAG: hypothetical protein HGB12_17180 [Bacteroidetes bacterium]|nr:hypothetical protein [Bacteroidota bacterium]